MRAQDTTAVATAAAPAHAVEPARECMCIYNTLYTHCCMSSRRRRRRRRRSPSSPGTREEGGKGERVGEVFSTDF